MSKIKILDPRELPFVLGAEYRQIAMACQEKMLGLRFCSAVYEMTTV
jgi:hypothetical protein